MEKKYYIYIHKRNDTGDIFYVGFGTKYGKKYSRSKELSKRHRNFLWWKIYNGCNRDISIEIVFESDIKKDAIQEEIRLISVYGRMIDGTGILTNLSDGGEYGGSPCRSISQYDKQGKFIKEWDSVHHIAQFYGVGDKAIYQSMKSGGVSAGFMWRYSDGLNNDIAPHYAKSNKKVSKYTKTGDYICTYDSLAEASKDTGIDRSSINHCALGNRVSCGGFCWSYADKPVSLPKDYLIVKYDMNMNRLSEYSYYSDIMKELNISSPTAIKNCFNGKQKQAYGFVWRKENPTDAKSMGLSASRLRKQE